MCGSCKTRDEDWKRDRDAFVGDITICPGCQRIEEEQENARNLKLRGARIGLVPKELAKSGEELGG